MDRGSIRGRAAVLLVGVTIVTVCAEGRPRADATQGKGADPAWLQNLNGPFGQTLGFASNVFGVLGAPVTISGTVQFLKGLFGTGGGPDEVHQAEAEIIAAINNAKVEGLTGSQLGLADDLQAILFDNCLSGAQTTDCYSVAPGVSLNAQHFQMLGDATVRANDVLEQIDTISNPASRYALIGPRIYAAATLVSLDQISRDSAAEIGAVQQRLLDDLYSLVGIDVVYGQNYSGILIGGADIGLAKKQLLWSQAKIPVPVTFVSLASMRAALGFAPSRGSVSDNEIPYLTVSGDFSGVTIFEKLNSWENWLSYQNSYQDWGELVPLSPSDKPWEAELYHGANRSFGKDPGIATARKAMVLLRSLGFNPTPLLQQGTNIPYPYSIDYQNSDDFDNDGQPDLLWHNGLTGQTAIWIMNGSDGSLVAKTPPAIGGGLIPDSTGWELVGKADFNRDGFPDLLWHNATYGDTTIWFTGPWASFVRTTQAIGPAVPANTGWRLVGAADFNQDGTPDFLWHNGSTGQSSVWFMGGSDGSTFLYSSDGFGSVTDSTGWKLIAAADFNHDGNPDLLWHNGVTGWTTIWYMGGAIGTTFLSSHDGLPGGPVPDSSGWTLKGTADFDLNGTPDLLWQHGPSGQVAYWLQDGADGSDFVRSAVVNLTVPSTSGWNLVSTPRE